MRLSPLSHLRGDAVAGAEDQKRKLLIASLMLGIVTLVLAVVIFLHPALIANIMMQTTGVALIIEGLALLIVMALKSKAA